MVGYALQRRLESSGITVSSLQPGYVCVCLMCVPNVYNNGWVGVGVQVKTQLFRGIQDVTFFSLLNKFGSMSKFTVQIHFEWGKGSRGLLNYVSTSS